MIKGEVVETRKVEIEGSAFELRVQRDADGRLCASPVSPLGVAKQKQTEDVYAVIRFWSSEDKRIERGSAEEARQSTDLLHRLEQELKILIPRNLVIYE